jgi:hypothetical protein
MTPEWRARIARHQAEVEDRVRHCGLPFAGLAEPAPGPGMIAATEGGDGILTSVGLCYGDPVRHDRPRVDVYTSRAAPDLRTLLEDALDQTDDDTPVAPDAEPTTLVVDDEERPATLLRAGTRLWAASCAHRDAALTVVARDWDRTEVRLVSVPDVEPFLQARAAYIAALQDSGPPQPPEPADVADPHRALVEAVLRISAEHRIPPEERRRRRGHRRLAQDIGGLWEATVREQMRLTGEGRTAANDAVTTLVNQLTGLAEHAAWFDRDDLREAAVGETIAYWTGADPAVPSRDAQRAWVRHWTGRHRPGAGPPGLGDPDGVDPAARRAWFEQLQATQDAWLDAWAAWVRARSG